MNFFFIFRLQGYTEKPIPTHRDIQRCLVEIGDKPFSFIDSKQWIGSTEVGFVLETLLGISIKVLCANSGEEISNLVPNLAYHFMTQGTPVMIGKHQKIDQIINFVEISINFSSRWRSFSTYNSRSEFRRNYRRSRFLDSGSSLYWI